MDALELVRLTLLSPVVLAFRDDSLTIAPR
jgi:hypothetical protein